MRKLNITTTQYLKIFNSKINSSDKESTEPIEYIKESRLHSEKNKMDEDK